MSAMKTGHASIVIIEPMDVERAGMAGADLPALPGTCRGGGATIGRDLADRQRLTAVLDGGVGLRDAHGHGSARIGGDGQGLTYVPTGLRTEVATRRTARKNRRFAKTIKKVTLVSPRRV
jgi:hypothetical protein